MSTGMHVGTFAVCVVSYQSVSFLSCKASGSKLWFHVP